MQLAKRRTTGPRYRCGKLKPEPVIPYRMEYITVNRQHDGTKFQTAIKDEGTTALDRLRFGKHITELQRHAGEEFHSIWSRARILYNASPNPNAQISQMEHGMGHSTDERQDPAAERKFRAARIYLRVQDGGFDLYNLTAAVCLYDMDPLPIDYGRLREGLEGLAKHFGLKA